MVTGMEPDTGSSAAHFVRNAAQDIRLVGNDGVSAAEDHISDIRGLVHCPGDDLHAVVEVESLDFQRVVLGCCEKGREDQQQSQ